MAPASGRLSGVSLGGVGVAAHDIRGIAAGGLGVKAEVRARGILIGGLGVGARPTCAGIAVGGSVSGRERTRAGSSSAGWASGAGENLRGIAHRRPGRRCRAPRERDRGRRSGHRLGRDDRGVWRSRAGRSARGAGSAASRRAGGWIRTGYLQGVGLTAGYSRCEDLYRPGRRVARARQGDPARHLDRDPQPGPASARRADRASQLRAQQSARRCAGFRSSICTCAERPRAPRPARGRIDLRRRPGGSPVRGHAPGRDRHRRRCSMKHHRASRGSGAPAAALGLVAGSAAQAEMPLETTPSYISAAERALRHRRRLGGRERRRLARHGRLQRQRHGPPAARHLLATTATGRCRSHPSWTASDVDYHGHLDCRRHQRRRPGSTWRSPSTSARPASASRGG